MLVSMLCRLISPRLAHYDLILFGVSHLEVSNDSQALCNGPWSFNVTGMILYLRGVFYPDLIIVQVHRGKRS